MGEQNWYCCPDGMYCAADASNCPFVGAKEQLTKLAMKKVVENNVKVALKKKDCDGTVCPGGCCPEQNWYCCPDGMYCAADASNCPFVAAMEVVALNRTGTAVLMACTVLLMPQTAPLLLPRRLLPPRRTVMVLSALEVAALNRTGTAALMACTVLLMHQTAPLLLPRRN